MLPKRYIIKSRRLNFLYYILSQNEESLIKQVFIAQIESTKNDWTEQVKQDLKELDMAENFNEIKQMSKLQFKNLIRKKSENAAFLYLLSQIKEMQDYLIPEAKLSMKENISIFKLRTTTLDIKTNMKHKNENDLCDECSKKGKIKTETQRHIYRCIELNGIKEHRKRPKYKDIFGNKIEKMKHILEIIHKNVMTRNQT